MPREYINRSGGRNRQVSAIAASAGPGDANKIVGTGATGKLDISLMPDGVGQDVQQFTFSEAAAAGALVNIAPTGARNADASAEGREAQGYILAAVASGASTGVYFDGTITGLTGLTIGARYFMSETAGAVTSTPVAVSGGVCQCVGVALTATSLTFELEDPVTLA